MGLFNLDNILGHKIDDSAIKGVQVDNTDIVVLITGPSGSCKTSLAEDLMKLHKAQETNSMAIMPSPKRSSESSETTFVYRTEVKAPEGSLFQVQHMLLIDCAGDCIDSTKEGLTSKRLRKWLDKNYSKSKEVDLVFYTIQGRNRVTSLKPDFPFLIAAKLLSKTVFVVAARTKFPRPVDDNDLLKVFDLVEKQRAICVRFQEPNDNGKKIDEIWAEIYKAACASHSATGCLASFCVGYMDLLPKSKYTPPTKTA